ncbi:MAG: hypothetical protein JWR84_2030 [Caulobacter sp.]|nr:hypothetical protein [Caulobacter sp.]
MFVAVYRMRLRPGSEARYEADWHTVTQIALDRFGSGGSALFKEADGTYVAIARWPSREHRKAFFERPDVDAALSARQHAAILERLPAMELDLVDDLWAPLPKPA